MQKELNDYLNKFNSAEFVLPVDYHNLLIYVFNESKKYI